MKSSTILILCLVAFLATGIPTAGAITVDGNLEDWGLGALAGPSSDWSANETWIPTDTTVHFVIENNDNPLHTGYPGFYAPGVHIIGSPLNWNFYDEKPGILKSTGQDVNVPWGGEPYDVEAIYLKQDNQNIYLAAITSMPQDGLNGTSSGQDETPSDLAMHFTNVPEAKFNFEYGVKLGSQKLPGNYNPGDIVYLPDWQSHGYILPATPDVMKSPALPGGSVVGTAPIAYTGSWINHVDHGSPQYVIELQIPKATVGLASVQTIAPNNGLARSQNVGLSNFLITQNCENDSIFVPEFPTIAVSAGAILGLIFVIYSLREKSH